MKMAYTDTVIDRFASVIIDSVSTFFDRDTFSLSMITTPLIFYIDVRPFVHDYYT